MPANLAAGWDLVIEFATNLWSIPEAHSDLQEHLGDQYIASEWNEPLDSASGAEGDVNHCEQRVDKTPVIVLN